MPLTAGQTLSSYEILSPLGSGGMAEVWRARDTRLDREVAIKVLSEQLQHDNQVLLRFEREAKTLASLSHPNIGGIYDVARVGELFFLVLELVPGEDLARRMARGSLSVPEALAIAQQVAEALAEAHRAGVVHRDLKPANVIVTPQGRVKVLDFGIAKCLGLEGGSAKDTARDPLTQEGTLVGTVDYMSPEQSRGREVDARADVWAFGCLLFELLSGTRIFPAENALEKLASIAADEPDWSVLPSATPTRVQSLLRRCLDKDIETRLSNLDEVGSLLEPAREARGQAELHSIAVLPFDNLSGDPEDAYFSEGVSDEILSALNGVAGLRVAARTSSFALKGRGLDVGEIGARLGVTRVLEGSVRRAGPRVRVSVQLINVADGYRLWSQRFDCLMRNIFELQDEIAGSIVKALQIELEAPAAAPLVSRRTRDPRAYDHFLRGRFYFEQRGSSLLQALDSYERALEIDPDFVAAHAGRAEILGLLPFWGAHRPSEFMPRARAAGERALELDSGHAEAHTALGWVNFAFDWDSQAAGERFQRALELDPGNLQAQLWHGCYVLTLGAGRHEEGLAVCREALQRDPLSINAHGQHIVALALAGRDAEALESTERGLELYPASAVLWHHLGLARSNRGDHEGARLALEHALTLSGDSVWTRALLGATYALSGDHKRAATMMSALLSEHATDYRSPTCLALTATGLGRLDLACDFIESAVAERDGLLRVMTVWRVFEPLLASERCAALLESAGVR